MYDLWNRLCLYLPDSVVTCRYERFFQRAQYYTFCGNKPRTPHPRNLYSIRLFYWMRAIIFWLQRANRGLHYQSVRWYTFRDIIAVKIGLHPFLKGGYCQRQELPHFLLEKDWYRDGLTGTYKMCLLLNKMVDILPDVIIYSNCPKISYTKVSDKMT